MDRRLLLFPALLALAACGSKAPEADATPDAAREAPEAAASRQASVFDQQLQALDKAKAVEGQLQDAKAKQDEEIRRQESGE